MSVIGAEGGPIEFLLIGDNPGDVLLTREAFRDTNTTTTCKSFRMAWRQWLFSGNRRPTSTSGARTLFCWI